MKKSPIFSIFIVLAAAATASCVMPGQEVALSQELKMGSKYPVFWPPKKGAKFPDLSFKNAAGEPVNLSRYQGKTILVEEIGMNCPACNAFSSTRKSGKTGFKGVHPQDGLPAIEDYLAGQGIDPHNEKLLIVDLLLYNMDMQAPSQQDARDWCAHFGITPGGNKLVLIGDKSLVSDASYNLIPGFQLIDPTFTLVSDSSGHNPEDDLWRVLVPKLKELLAH